MAHSQKDFREGFLITKKSDTLWGFVNYREGNSQYHNFEFKRTQTDPIEKFDPEMSLGYGFADDKKFSRQSVVIDGRSYHKFFEILIDGGVSLYKYENRFFVRDNSMVLRELTNESREVEIDGKIYSKNSNRYQGLLTVVLENCKSSSSRIKNTRFNEKDLTELILYYNQCTGVQVYSYKSDKPWSQLNLGVSIGYNYSVLQTNSKLDNNYYLQNSFDPATSVMPGLFVEFTSPRINERISIYSGAFYLKSSYVMNGFVPSPFLNRRDYVTFDVQEFKVPLGIRYTFPVKNVTPYINAGALFSWQTGYDYYRLQEIESNNIVTSYEHESPEIENNQLGVWTGLGLFYKLFDKSELFTELRYDLSSGYFGSGIDGTISDDVSNLQLHLGIKF